MENNNKRFELLNSIFEKGKYFKIVCGAGNEDKDEIYRLSMIYTLAGATAIDVSANVDIVKSARRGIEWAKKLAPELNRKILFDPFINVSIGLKGDPHVRKAQIDPDTCIQCGNCLEACHQKAISYEFVINEKRCIGCGACGTSCTSDAVVYYDKRADFEKILPECIDAGTETMELHAVTDDEEGVAEDWTMLNEIITDNFVSMCFDRNLLSNKHFIERVKFAHSISGDRTIIQADGAPMSGGKDDYRTTLQAVSVAEIVEKSRIPVKILVSGGTNSRTGELLKKCSINVHGVAIGTFARKIVYDLIWDESFDESLELIGKAVKIAEDLINVNIKEISHD